MVNKIIPDLCYSYRRDRPVTCPNSSNISSHTLRRGLTLMELILSIALLSILAAASFGVIYWQAKIYFHIEQRTEAMQQLTNTYMVIYKEVKKWSRTGIDTTGNIILKQSSLSNDFIYDSSTKELSWQGAPILKNAVASFSYNPTEKIVVGTLQKLSNDNTKILAIKFVIHPRNQ